MPYTAVSLPMGGHPMDRAAAENAARSSLSGGIAGFT